ncbi:MAG: N-6 DNA methylase [Candidatus Kapaibacterium sp.]
MVNSIIKELGDIMSWNDSELYKDFTRPWNGNYKIYSQLESFAKMLGWYPSDIIEEVHHKNIITGHLFVEHGLNNSAVITFINSSSKFEDFTNFDVNNVLNISYNNLVDLHISVDNSKVFGLHNRMQIENVIYSGNIATGYSNLRSDFFVELLSSKSHKTNILPLDDTLIETISFWKRVIASTTKTSDSNEELSVLFNALIFCRAVEDHYYKKELHTKKNRKLLATLYNSKEKVNIKVILKKTLEEYGVSKVPNQIITWSKLDVFENLGFNTIEKLFNDFYFARNTPYEYDFSIISKHALSRIYEKYVSVLRVIETRQLSFVNPIPDELQNETTGSYYTPQFIARFFARYIEKLKPDFKTEQVKIVEPSVGSGIFLRTLLEMKVDNIHKPEFIIDSYNAILGVDINPTACHAAQLSLSLLHLVTTDTLPSKKLNIITADSLEYFSKNNFNEYYDVCVSNPPFISYNNLTDSTREKLKDVLGEYSYGRPDIYLAFLKIAVDILNDGGIGLFVLPNTFLVSESASKIREYLKENTFIKAIVDLSTVQVFSNASVNTILLIFQKQSHTSLKQTEAYESYPLALITKVRDNVGKALFDTIRFISGNRSHYEDFDYSIYEVNQNYFSNENWYLLPPYEYLLKNKLNTFTKLGDFADIRTGFSSGAGEVFLLEKKDIPSKENSAFIPYLNDREMGTYTIPRFTLKYLFYPFINGKPISDESILKEKYPNTYNMLLKSKSKLSKRREVLDGKIPWWMPQRPRKPDFMLVPKIVTPHLIFLPKFSIDIEGKYAVSRAPFIVLNEDKIKLDTTNAMFYVTAVLNSSVCFWYLLTHAPKYQHGYVMLEKKYLADLPIPDPTTSDRRLVQSIIKLAQKLHHEKDKKVDIENKIDVLVAELFGLSMEEMKFLRIG